MDSVLYNLLEVEFVQCVFVGLCGVLSAREGMMSVSKRNTRRMIQKLTQ